ERVLDNLVRLAALDVGDEADAAGILVARRVVEAVRGRQTGIGRVAIEQARVERCVLGVMRCRRRHSNLVDLVWPLLAHSYPLSSARWTDDRRSRHRMALRPKANQG